MAYVQCDIVQQTDQARRKVRVARNVDIRLLLSRRSHLHIGRKTQSKRPVEQSNFKHNGSASYEIKLWLPRSTSSKV